MHIALIPNTLSSKSQIFLSPFSLQVPVGPTLNHSQKRSIIVLKRYITCGLIQGRVGLNKHLARLLVVENNVANLCAPKVEANVAHSEVEFGSSLDVGS